MASFSWVDDPVVPESRGGVIGARFFLVARLDTFANLGQALIIDLLASRAAAFPANLGQDSGRLLAAHDGDAVRWPREDEARIVGTAAHRVVSRAVTGTDHDCQLRYLRESDRRHHLGAVSRNPFPFVLAPDDESGDVLKEEQGDFLLSAEHHEVGALAR